MRIRCSWKIAALVVATISPAIAVLIIEIRSAMREVGERPGGIQLNYRFDVDEWLPRFPLDRNATRYSGQDVTSPSDVCNNVLLRREMQDQYDWGPGVPVDIFVMADGEPSDRSVTKIGGLPYRPARLSWPDRNGDPLLFLAQFNFTESTDLVGRLPGDLLLVFAAWDDGLVDDYLHLEWQDLNSTDLIDAEEIPNHPHQIKPCYGYRFRTVSFPKAREKHAVSQQKYPRCLGKEVWSSYFLLEYQATQIGSAPFFIQGDDDLPGRPICTISSVQPDLTKPFPWVNHPEPLSLPKSAASGALMSI